MHTNKQFPALLHWQMAMQSLLKNFQCSELYYKTSHIPYSVSTTTITCEKVFFSNLIPAHLEQHTLEGHRLLPFRYLYTVTLSLSYQPCDFSNLNSSSGFPKFPELSPTLLTLPWGSPVGLLSCHCVWFDPGRVLRQMPPRSLLKYLLSAQHVPGT